MYDIIFVCATNTQSTKKSFLLRNDEIKTQQDTFHKDFLNAFKINKNVVRKVKTSLELER